MNYSDKEKLFLKGMLGEQAFSSLFENGKMNEFGQQILLPKVALAFVEKILQLGSFSDFIPGIEKKIEITKNQENSIHGSIGSISIDGMEKYDLAAILLSDLDFQPQSKSLEIPHKYAYKIGEVIDSIVSANIEDLIEQKDKSMLKQLKLGDVGEHSIVHTGNPKSPYSIVHVSGKTVQDGIQSHSDAMQIAKFHQSKIDRVSKQKQFKSRSPILKNLFKSLVLADSDFDAVCEQCNHEFFQDRNFIGCSCIDKSQIKTKTIKKNNKNLLSFSDDMSLEDVEFIQFSIKKGSF